MPINVDFAAIIVMESLGLVSFLFAFLFFRQRQKMSEKQRQLLDASKKGLVSERGDGKCYSSEWAMDNIVYKRKKMLNASPFLLMVIATLTAVLYFEVGSRAFSALLSLGYVTVVALVGFAILTETDVFEAYSYCRAVHNVSIMQFDKADESYMAIAEDALKMATARFLMLGIFFAAVGPFIPQIFSGALSTVLYYTGIVLYATGASSEFSEGLAVMLAIILPGLVLFVPLLFGKAIFFKVKVLAQKMLRRPREQ